MIHDRNGLEVLDRNECLRLLSSAGIGRIAITRQALPMIVPVNFLLDGVRLLIRTTPGTKLDAAAAGAVVAFEVDAIDPIGHAGWSVSVTGVAGVVSDEEDLARISGLPLARWAPPVPGIPEHVLAISTEIMTGRRLAYGHREGAMGSTLRLGRALHGVARREG